MQQFLQVAHLSAEVGPTTNPSLLSALGIDPMLLLFQTGAFLVLVLILAKFVYPHIIKAIDQRRDSIEKGLAQAKQAEEALTLADRKVSDAVRAAHTEATEIIARSKQEAAALLETAEKRADERASRIVADAKNQMDVELSAAREALRHEAAELVAKATARIIHEKVDADKDAKLIATSLKEAE